MDKVHQYLVEDKRTNVAWVVEEKVHGANMALYFYKGKCKIATRNKWLENENFFNAREVVEKLKDKFEHIIEMYRHLSDPEIIIYGEIFGGCYIREKHKDIILNSGNLNTVEYSDGTKVQKGVWYCPTNEYMVFDICINGAFINRFDFYLLCEQAGIFYSKPLGSGSLEQCLKTPNEFGTTIPAHFGLWPIKNNTCEGIVIKPDITLYLETGERVIFKSKNGRFVENKSISKVHNTNSIHDPLFDIVDPLVTDGRIASVISKIADADLTKFSQIMKELNTDIWEELEGTKLRKEDTKIINKRIGKIAPRLIRNYFTKPY